MAATATPGVETYVNGLNPAGNGTLLISATSGFSNCYAYEPRPVYTKRRPDRRSRWRNRFSPKSGS